MIKLTVQEWKDFNEDSLTINNEDIWGNWYIDDCSLIHNGEELEDGEFPDLSPNTIISVDGVLCNHYTDSHKELVPIIKAWRKQKTTALVTIEIKKENLDQLKEVVKQLKGKIIL